MRHAMDHQLLDKDLDFAGSVHAADSTNRERLGKPLGIEGFIASVPISGAGLL
jgi:hypothetical protein